MLIRIEQNKITRIINKVEIMKIEIQIKLFNHPPYPLHLKNNKNKFKK